jgi:hypothetical protein
MTTSPDEAAEKVVDPERLLPSEAEDSLDPHEIALWSAVYQDLVEFKAGLLRDIHAQLEDRLPQARREIQEVDIVALEAELERLTRRRDFWHSRLNVAGLPD